MSGTRLIPTVGCDIHVLVEGEGPATLFVHGFGGDLHGWDRLCGPLACERRVIRPDLRGFGRSVTHEDAPFHHADDLAALLDALDVDRCDLVGLSMGGAISISFAIDRPDRVRSLSLLSPGLAGWDWSQHWRDLWRPLVTAAREGDMDGARRLWLDHPMFASARGTAAFDLFAAEVARFAGDQWRADRQAPALPDIDRLHGLTMPLLLLTGGQDMAEMRLIADLIAATVPDVTRYDRRDLGHMIHLEDPDWCRDRLKAFWAGPAMSAGPAR